MALAMTLLTAGGLMGRSLQRQLDVRVGFNPDGVTAARLTMPRSRYAPEQRHAFVSRVEEALRRQPLVADVAIGSDLPFTGNSSASTLTPDRDPEALVRYYRHSVTPDYFRTLSMPMLRGRSFTPDDRAGRPLVAIITDSGARRIWSSDDAIGRRFRMGGAQAPEVQIVGVIADARFRSLIVDVAGPGAEPDIFFPFGQRTDADLEIACTLD